MRINACGLYEKRMRKSFAVADRFCCCEQKRLNMQVVISLRFEVVEYLKGHSADLVMLDMIMDPGMDGLDTYRQILVHRPLQKAIIASGYAETDRVRQARQPGAGAYLKKPYRLERIGQVVRDELRDV